MNEFIKMAEARKIVLDLAKALNCTEEEIIEECKKLTKQHNKRIMFRLARELTTYVRAQARNEGNVSPAQWVNDLIKWHRLETSRRAGK